MKNEKIGGGTRQPPRPRQFGGSGRGGRPLPPCCQASCASNHSPRGRAARRRYARPALLLWPRPCAWHTGEMRALESSARISVPLRRATLSHRLRSIDQAVIAPLLPKETHQLGHPPRGNILLSSRTLVQK